MQIRLVALFVVAVIAALTSGCATVTGSTSQSIAVETRTQNQDAIADANCRLSNAKGTWFVKTPGSTTITRSNDSLQVSCEKEGQPMGSAVAVSATRGAIFGNIIIGGVIGAVIDHSTGSAYEYPNIIRVIMGTMTSVGPPDLTGDGQPPVVFTPTQPSTQSVQKQQEPTVATAETSRDARLPARMPQVGDTWKYRYIDRWTQLTKGPIVHQVVAVSDKEIREYTRLETSNVVGAEYFIPADAQFVEHRLSGVPEFAPYLQAYGLLDKQAHWENIPADSGSSSKWLFSAQVVGREVIAVPAGTFTATRVELSGRKDTSGPVRAVMGTAHVDPTRAKFVIWYVPEVKRVVRYTREVTNWNGAALDKDTYELIEYKLN
jgi:hypothetical protein